MKKYEIVKGNIVDFEVDAVVNAANSRLKPGDGVCGAIYLKAGNELIFETNSIGICQPGSAVITKGYNLKSDYIIHAVAPIYRGGSNNEKEILKATYKSVMDMAIEHKIKTIAIPSLGTGIYGNPLEQSAEIALHTVIKYLEENEVFVYFVCFDDKTYEAYMRASYRLEQYNK